MEKIIAGQAAALQVDFEDPFGNFITPSEASYSIIDEHGTYLKQDEPILVSSPSELIVIPDSDNELAPDQISAYRMIVITFKDDTFNTYTVSRHYVIQRISTLEVGVTGFGTMGELMIQATRMPELDELLAFTPDKITAALAGAYFNIGRLNIELRSGNKVFNSTFDMTYDDVMAMDIKSRLRFVQAQLIEANFLLGGNPVEQRRRMGLLSESVGEVSQFFRTVRPVILPVSDDCARILSPFIRRSLRIAR